MLLCQQFCFVSQTFQTTTSLDTFIIRDWLKQIVESSAWPSPRKNTYVNISLSNTITKNLEAVNFLLYPKGLFVILKGARQRIKIHEGGGGCYRSLTLVLAFCEGSHISHQYKFSSFLTLYTFPHIPKASGFCEEKFQRFSEKNLWVKNEKSMKNLLIFFLNSYAVPSTRPGLPDLWSIWVRLGSVIESRCRTWVSFRKL